MKISCWRNSPEGINKPKWWFHSFELENGIYVVDWVINVGLSRFLLCNIRINVFCKSASKGKRIQFDVRTKVSSIRRNNFNKIDCPTQYHMLVYIIDFGILNGSEIKKNNFRYFVDVVLSLNTFNGKITIFFLIEKVFGFFFD